MLDIPASFIISSRLSTLDSKDILRIIHLAEPRWQEGQIKQRMLKHHSTPILGIGISNPQELSQVISSDIPIIHIQNDCKSLQAVQKRSIQQYRFTSRFLMTGTASLWGLFGHQVVSSITQVLLKSQGNDMVQLPVLESGNIPVPKYIICGYTLSVTLLLGWISKRLLYDRMRNEYQCMEKEGEFLLLRNDVLYGKFRYFIQTIIPYCFIGLSVYHYKIKKEVC